MDSVERAKKWGKYADLIDAETWAFIDKTNDSYPEDAVELSIEEQRNVYDVMCAQFRVEYPEGVVATDSVVSTQTFCWIKIKLCAIKWLSLVTHSILISIAFCQLVND